MDFTQLGVKQGYLDVLKREGIVTPTPIQQACIEPISQGNDVIAKAQTGTGKTLAFLLPIMALLDQNNPVPQCLIITPTRELALQITVQAQKLADADGLGVVALYGGKELAPQIKKLEQGAQLVIGTPGRLLDHLDREHLNLSQLRTVILDEADEILLMGFKNEVEDILSQTPKKKQLLCFSATMDKAVKKLAYHYMNHPLEIAIEEQSITLENIRQCAVETKEPLKREALCAVLDQDRPFMAIIFCRTKRRVDDLTDYLKAHGYDCAALHSDIAQNKRERIMKTFRKGDLPYLVATDVAARGLDINGVTHIYNYDLPETAESYIHRIGRTGRAGEEGQTCLFFSAKEERAVAELEQAISMRIPRRSV